MPTSKYDDLAAEPDEAPANSTGIASDSDDPRPTDGDPDVDYSDHDDGPDVFEFANTFVGATLDMLPISRRARDSATTILHEVTGIMKKKRIEDAKAQAQKKREQEEREREEAKLRAQEQLEQEQRDREVAARMGRLKVEREASERLQRLEDIRREQEVQEALQRGAAAEATLDALANAHWVEKAVVSAAREQAQSLKTAIEMAEGLGVSREVIEASLQRLLTEQMLGTSKLVTDFLLTALEVEAPKRARRAKGKSYGPVA